MSKFYVHLFVSCSPQSQTLWCPAYHRVWFCGILPTAESDSVMSCPPQSLPLQCPAYCRVRLCGVLTPTKSDSVWSCHLRVRLCGFLSTAVTNSVVSCSPQRLTLRCPIHHRVRLCGVLFTTESDYEVFCLLQWLTLWCPVHHRVWLCGFLYTAVTNSVVSCSLQSLTVLYVDWLCDVQFTTESDSVMSCLPKSLTLRCPAFCYLISCPHITAEIVLDLQSPQHCTYCTVSLHDKIVGAYIKYDTRGRQKIRQLCKSSTFISQGRHFYAKFVANYTLQHLAASRLLGNSANIYIVDNFEMV